MKFSISTVALVAHILIGHSLAARVVVNSQNQLQLIENDTPTLKNNLDARQVPINGNDTPRGAAPGGPNAPKDMQPKPNDVLPLPTPVIPGSAPPKVPAPKIPYPVNDPVPGPVKPPIAGRSVWVRATTASDNQQQQQEQQQHLKRRRNAQSPPLLPPPKAGDSDPSLPKIIPQPKVPGIPNQPKVPVPVETERPVPMTFAR